MTKPEAQRNRRKKTENERDRYLCDVYAGSNHLRKKQQNVVHETDYKARHEQKPRASSVEIEQQRKYEHELKHQHDKVIAGRKGGHLTDERYFADEREYTQVDVTYAREIRLNKSYQQRNGKNHQKRNIKSLKATLNVVS